MIRTIELDGRKIEYDLQRKKVKNINLRIRPDMSVSVSANIAVPLGYIESFLRSKSDHILRALDRFASRQPQQTKLLYVSGEMHNLFGNEAELIVIEGGSDGVIFDSGRIILTVADTSDTLRKKRVIDAWRRSLCEYALRGICEKIYPAFREYGIAFPELRFRKMKSRWGSCQPARGVVTFNTHLTEVPMPAVEYVAMHEFVHFLEPNHSKRFYAHLTRLMPDWTSRRNMLISRSDFSD